MLCDLRISIWKQGNSLKLVNYKSAMPSMQENGESAVRLAKYLTWWFIKQLVSRCCVANLTCMLQTSSFNQTHVLVASNSISLSCLEGRIYIITVLNPLPVLIILLNQLPGSRYTLKILREILSFTRSFMMNTHSLVGCLENSDRKVKQFRVIPRIASVVLFIVRRCDTLA